MFESEKKQKQKHPNCIHITKDSKNKERLEIENNVEMFAKILRDKSLPFSFGRKGTFILENLEYEISKFRIWKFWSQKPYSSKIPTQINDESREDN